MGDKNKFFESPIEPVRTPSLEPSNKGAVNGEPGYKKRTGGAFPEKTRDLTPGLQKPTKS
jgi:hypothetical protein